MATPPCLSKVPGDTNAAGWGWFVDPTPWEDCEFTTPGNQDEQKRMDMLSALACELYPPPVKPRKIGASEVVFTDAETNCHASC
ncbi:MAG: hypothetical protein HY040_07220 [Planctomycetes bacterium]|nr:hypothetical protein [Planctomycetota bacterium]